MSVYYTGTQWVAVDLVTGSVFAAPIRSRAIAMLLEAKQR